MHDSHSYRYLSLLRQCSHLFCAIIIFRNFGSASSAVIIQPSSSHLCNACKLLMQCCMSDAYFVREFYLLDFATPCLSNRDQESCNICNLTSDRYSRGTWHKLSLGYLTPVGEGVPDVWSEDQIKVVPEIRGETWHIGVSDSVPV